MSLAFLTPDGPGIASPLAPALRKAGATFEIRDGWEIPVTFGSRELEQEALAETVAWTDRSHQRKWELQGDPEDFDRLTADARLLRTSPTRGLLIDCDEPSFDGSVLDVTTQLAAIAVAGPSARETIARFCALDLRPVSAPVGSFLPGSVARTPGYVVVEAEQCFLLLFGAAFGEYAWEVVSDAGSHLGGRPVGVDVIEAGRPDREESPARA